MSGGPAGAPEALACPPGRRGAIGLITLMAWPQLRPVHPFCVDGELYEALASQDNAFFSDGVTL